MAEAALNVDHKEDENSENQSQSVAKEAPQTSSVDKVEAAPSVDKVEAAPSVNKVEAAPSVDKIQPNLKYSKVTSKAFIKKLTMVENSQKEDVIINEKLYIEGPSYVLCHHIPGDMVECFACKVTFDASEICRHNFTKTHKIRVMRIPVLEVEGEFIREVHPEVYHCGICNSIHNGLDDLEAHLKSSTHEERKLITGWNMLFREYPGVRTIGEFREIMVLNHFLKTLPE